MERFADGVLPDDVIRDKRSNAELMYLTLADGADVAAVEGFVQGLYGALSELTSSVDGDQAASACVGWGERLFSRLPARPAGFPLTVTTGAVVTADVAVYVMCRAEFRLAAFYRWLAQLGVGLITAVEVVRGFQRPDGREPGGFRDGLRNAQNNRTSTVFVDPVTAPDEPPAASGGTYMVTMKILQDLEKWDQLTIDQQQAIIGRRRVDGSRIDQPEGTPIAAEPEIVPGGPMPSTSHVAKAGPRGAARDLVAIFRRGFPFSGLTSTGALETGLEFVSFQASMLQFITIRDQWMGNNDFPQPGTGHDALFQNGLATVINTGAFFVPALLGAYPGQGFFHPEPEDDRCLGYITVHKTVVNPAGTQVQTELGGFSFQLLDPAGTAIGNPFITDSAGRATSPPAPRGITYTLRETSTRPDIPASADQQIALDHHALLVKVTNTTANPNPGYH